jgi:hypothetical protein
MGSECALLALCAHREDEGEGACPEYTIDRVGDSHAALPTCDYDRLQAAGCSGQPWRRQNYACAV